MEGIPGGSCSRVPAPWWGTPGPPPSDPLVPPPTEDPGTVQPAEFSYRAGLETDRKWIRDAHTPKYQAQSTLGVGMKSLGYSKMRTWPGQAANLDRATGLHPTARHGCHSATFCQSLPQSQVAWEGWQACFPSPRRPQERRHSGAAQIRPNSSEDSLVHRTQRLIRTAAGTPGAKPLTFPDQVHGCSHPLSLDPSLPSSRAAQGPNQTADPLVPSSQFSPWPLSPLHYAA